MLQSVVWRPGQCLHNLQYNIYATRIIVQGVNVGYLKRLEM